MAKLIVFRAWGNALKEQSGRLPLKVLTPFLLDAAPMSEEEIERKVAAYLENRSKENLDEAVLAFSSIVRYLTARLLGAFKSTLTYADDLVSVAFVELLARLPCLETAEGCCRMLSFKIVDAQVEYVNKMNSPVSIAVSTLHSKGGQQRGKVDIDTVGDKTPHELNEDEQVIDLFDSLESLVCNGKHGYIFEYLLDPANWSKKVEEQATELEISVRSLCRHRETLYNKIVESMQ